MTREDIVRAARGFIGVRFRHQGRAAQEGLDCLGLLLAIADSAGLVFQNKSVFELDVRSYGSKPDTDFLQARLEQNLQRTEMLELGSTDILLLTIDGRPQHLAMVTDYPTPSEWGMIHAYAPSRAVVEHRITKEWKERIAGVYRLPQFA